MRVSFATVTLVAAAFGAVHIAAYQAGRRGLAGATKAVPIFLAFAWTLTCEPAVGEGYRRLVAAGLLFGMGGDLLLLSRARFRAGLGSFFAGHVAYTLAFVAASAAFTPALGWLAVIGTGAGLALRRLWPHVGRERLPVACYVAMIALMAWTALGRGLAAGTPQPSGMEAALGAVLFMASDTILAFDRFVRPWRGAHAAVMLTYYAAQLLIAASVGA